MRFENNTGPIDSYIGTNKSLSPDLVQDTDRYSSYIFSRDFAEHIIDKAEELESSGSEYDKILAATLYTFAGDIYIHRVNIDIAQQILDSGILNSSAFEQELRNALDKILGTAI